MSSMALINGDCKEFSFNAEAFKGSVAFSVVETTDDEVILSRTEELIIELTKQKNEKGEGMVKYILLCILSSTISSIYFHTFLLSLCIFNSTHSSIYSSLHYFFQVCRYCFLPWSTSSRCTPHFSCVVITKDPWHEHRFQVNDNTHLPSL